jgi:hypothetical protein
MQQFRTALSEITKDGTPLIIVVDELDRCRPDYALTVLEVIKHFFAVDRVHFVMGVNLEALEHMVRVRYGATIDAADYLKRFISLSLQLPQFVGGRDSVHASIRYLVTTGAEMGINQKALELTSDQIKLAIKSTSVTLRDIEKILTRLALLPKRKEFQRNYPGYQFIIVTLILWQVLKRDYFLKAMKQTLAMEAVDEFFGITEAMLDGNSPAYEHKAYIISGVWRYALTGQSLDENDKGQFAKFFDDFGRATKIFEIVEREFFGLFEVQD